MPQKFFTDTIESKFIKNLLLNTPLPLMNTASGGDFIVEDCVYVYENSLIRCTKTGYLPGEDHNHLDVSELLTVSNNLVVGKSADLAQFVVLQPFEFGEQYDKITENYISKYNYYDSDTHRYLGKYLRCLRDIKGIDLMPFYNCFNYKMISDLYLTTEGWEEGNSSDYKILAIPIKFNRKYTVAIDCSSRVLFKSIFYGPVGIIRDSSGAEFSTRIDENVIEHNHLDFKHPVIYSVQTDDKELLDIERYLYLIVQLPSFNTSSIVVLEGDYTAENCKYVIDASHLDTLDNSHINHCLLTPLSLLQLNDRNIYAFSDRLIEYLLWNAITSDDEISDNIERVQRYAGLVNTADIFPGIFDRYTRYTIYNKYVNDAKTTNLDVTGFVDKNVESFLTRGVDV